MPLFLCPNDNQTMKTVERDGVEFDICPTCRGVWLDRGELEKLLSAERGAETPAPRTRREGSDRPLRGFIHRNAPIRIIVAMTTTMTIATATRNGADLIFSTSSIENDAA